MKVKTLQNAGETTFALIFDKGDEVVAELTAFARKRQVTAAHFTAIGALSDVTLGFFDRNKKDYTKIPVAEQVEVLSLVGDIALDGREPKVHAHVVIGKADGTAHGGHLIAGHVWPTLELILTAEMIDAQEAYRIGLVNTVVPATELLRVAGEMLRKILANGPVAVAMSIEAVVRGVELPLEDALLLEADQFGLMASTDDMREGMRAFLEKRPPRFTGR